MSFLSSAVHLRTMSLSRFYWNLVTNNLSSIVALHGLTGHAWNTFTKSETLNSDTNNIQDINWLRDLLPDLLENNAPIRYRIMTFGYDADVWMSKSVADIHTYVGNLLKYLEVERKEVCLVQKSWEPKLNKHRTLKDPSSSSDTVLVV